MIGSFQDKYMTYYAPIERKAALESKVSERLCEKNSVNSKTVIKNDIWERLELAAPIFYSIQ